MKEYIAILFNPKTNTIRETIFTIEAENILEATKIYSDICDQSVIEILQIKRVI